MNHYHQPANSAKYEQIKVRKINIYSFNTLQEPELLEHPTKHKNRYVRI